MGVFHALTSEAAAVANRATVAPNVVQQLKVEDSDDEDFILGFMRRSKYQILVPDPMPDEAADASVGRAAELLQAALRANSIKLEVKSSIPADSKERMNCELDQMAEDF